MEAAARCIFLFLPCLNILSQQLIPEIKLNEKKFYIHTHFSVNRSFSDLYTFVNRLFSDLYTSVNRSFSDQCISALSD